MAAPLRVADLAPPRVTLTGATGPRADEPADAELVARALATGAPEWYEAIARRHYRAAFAVALAITTDVADAEDACQEGLARALARLADCRQPERVAEWVTAVVRNQARNVVSRSPARRAVAIEPTVPSPSPGAHEALARADARDALVRALATLSDVQREVVLLHDLHDWPHARIAAWIGTSAGMCRQHLFKARRALRACIDPTLLQELRDA